MTTPNGSTQASASEVGAALRRRWWVILLCLLLGAGAGVAAALNVPERHIGSVTVLVQLPQGAVDTEALVRTVEALASSTVVLGDVSEEPGVELSAQEIDDRLRVERAAGSAVIEVSVEDASEEQVEAVVEEIVPALVARLDEISTEAVVTTDGQDQEVTTSVPIEVVTFGRDPYVRPKPRQPVVAGALGGVGLGLLAAVVITLRAGTRRRA